MMDGKKALAELHRETHLWLVSLPIQQKTALYIKGNLDRLGRRLTAVRSLKGSTVASTLLAAVFAVASDATTFFCALGGAWIAVGIAASVVEHMTKQKIAYFEKGREALREAWTAEGVEPGKTCVIDADGTIEHVAHMTKNVRSP